MIAEDFMLNFKTKMKMKKFMLALALVASMLFVGCNGCNKIIKNVEVPVTTELVVENTISADLETMYLSYGDGYQWFETNIKLNQFIDEDCDGSAEMIVNVFQNIVQLDSTSFDVKVYKFQHFADGTTVSDFIDGFWIDDKPLNETIVELTFKEAFDRLMSSNYSKPHSKYVTIRKPIGPKDVNAQYVFGNVHENLWVDAVTGEVKNSNPAFEGFDTVSK